MTTISVAPSSRCASQQHVDDRLGGRVVERAGRLVGEDHARPVDQRAGDRHALALPARELVGQLVGVLGQPQARQQLGAALVAAARAAQRELQRDVLDRREERQEVVRLEDEPDLVGGGCAPARARAGSRSPGRRSRRCPADGLSRPPIRPSSVDFPQPLGPVTARLAAGLHLEASCRRRRGRSRPSSRSASRAPRRLMPGRAVTARARRRPRGRAGARPARRARRCG